MNWPAIKQGFATVGAQLAVFKSSYPFPAGLALGLIAGLLVGFCTH